VNGKYDFSYVCKLVLTTSYTKNISDVDHNFTVINFAKYIYTHARESGQSLRKTKNFSPLQIFPSLMLALFLVTLILFPPLEFAFAKSVFALTHPPWFEKIVEVYLFLISLWSFVLMSKTFTLRLWLQTISAFIIRDISWAVGYVKGILD